MTALKPRGPFAGVRVAAGLVLHVVVYVLTGLHSLLIAVLLAVLTKSRQQLRRLMRRVLLSFRYFLHLLRLGARLFLLLSNTYLWVLMLARLVRRFCSRFHLCVAFISCSRPASEKLTYLCHSLRFFCVGCANDATRHCRWHGDLDAIALQRHATPCAVAALNRLTCRRCL